MRAARALATTVAVMVLGGCTADPPVDGGPPTDEATTAGAVAAPEAADLRFRLERQLGMFTAAVAAFVRGHDGADIAVEEALNELATTVADAYDRATGRQFADLAGAYAQSLVRYRTALQQETDVRDARADVLELPADIAAFMARVTDGGMAVEGTAALVRGPTMSLLRMVSAQVERNFDTAYTEQRDAYAMMISVGRAFAAGISEQLPEQFPGLRTSGAIELRSALHQLLGEHALLAVAAVRSGIRSARDFDAAAAALNGNTEDLSSALESIYSSDASGFAELWRSRISTLADYSVAAARGRNRPADRFTAALARSDARIAAQLAEMSEGSIVEDAATEALGALTRHLVRATDALVERDFDRAQAATEGAHLAGAELAAVIAEGIAAHRPSEFPQQ